MSRKERIWLNCSLAAPPPTTTTPATTMDGSHTPNTPDILNTIVNLTSGGPLFSDYTQPRMSAPPLPPSFLPPHRTTAPLSSLAQMTRPVLGPDTSGLSGHVGPYNAAPHISDEVPLVAVPPTAGLYSSAPVVGLVPPYPVTTSPPPMYPQKPAAVLSSPGYSDTSGI